MELLHGDSITCKKIGRTPLAWGPADSLKRCCGVADLADIDRVAAHLDGQGHLADQRYAAIIESGKTIPWAQMRQYLEQRISGTPAKRPSAKKLAR